LEISYEKILLYANNMSCICNNCGRKYKVDLLVPDDIWNKIRPIGSKGEGGLLCPICIAEKLESLGDYDYWYLTKENKEEINDKS
jgi:hypothetical protein